MKHKRGFYDLCVTPTSTSSLVNILTTLVELGYRTVAVNQMVEESELVQEKNKKKRKADNNANANPLIPPPVKLDDIPEVLRSSIQILHRITISFSTSDNAHKMISSDNIKKYDIIAVIPTSKAALMHTCNTLDVDIISFDTSTKMPVQWNRKLHNLAAEKGMWFELPYGLGVLDSTARRNLIQAGHSYHAIGKSKNVLISSGAQNPMQIRGPYDVINMGLLLGLSEEQAKSAITNAGRAVTLRAESRRRGKAVVCIEKIVSNPPDIKVEEDNCDNTILPVHKKKKIMGTN